ncbi:MAG TPA: GNAT family N-acetyltransferase [Candidatus Eisenbacteria bacterium]
MAFTLRPYTPSDLATFQALLDAPGIAGQFDTVARPGGVERILADSYTPSAGVRLAFVDGEPAGFAFPIVLPGPPAPWAALRGAVVPRFRRQGIARALHDAVVAWLEAHAPVREQTISAWEPEPGADGFAAALGYAHDRWYWLMERPRDGTPPAPEWPAGVTVRPLDGSDAMLADWNAAYNASFEAHYRYVASPLEHAHKLVESPGFRADGVLLAYRQGRVAGFCRNELHATRGEVGTLGTVPAARGIGLGRALLRWGVGWLERESTLPVTLMVDGANDGALALYRSEGFAVTRTRHAWMRPGGGA